MTVRHVAASTALAALLATLGLQLSTSAESSATAVPASIRSAHLSPDMAGMDVYLVSASGASKLWMSDEKYGSVSSYVAVPPGIYTISLRKHGAASTAKATMSWRLAAAPGKAYTVAVVGAGSKSKGTVLFDSLSTPRAGTGRVRVIQAASAATRATVVATGGPVVARNAAYGTSTGYAQVPAGTWPLTVTATGQPPLTAKGSVSVPSASVTSILLLDSPRGGLTLRTVVDAAGARTAPAGAVPAGGGSTATLVVDRAYRGQQPALALMAASALGVLGVGAVGLGAAGRRRVRSRRPAGSRAA